MCITNVKIYATLLTVGGSNLKYTTGDPSGRCNTSSSPSTGTTSSGAPWTWIIHCKKNILKNDTIKIIYKNYIIKEITYRSRIPCIKNVALLIIILLWKKIEKISVKNKKIKKEIILKNLLASMRNHTSSILGGQ